MTCRLQHIQYQMPKGLYVILMVARGLVLLTLMYMLFVFFIIGDVPSEESKVIVWVGKARGHWGDCNPLKHMIKHISM